MGLVVLAFRAIKGYIWHLYNCHEQLIPFRYRALGNYAKSVSIDPVIPRATDFYNRLHAEYMAEKLLAQDKDEVSRLYSAGHFHAEIM